MFIHHSNRVADFTAGRESHPALKIFSYYDYYILLLTHKMYL